MRHLAAHRAGPRSDSKTASAQLLTWVWRSKLEPKALNTLLAGMPQLSPSMANADVRALAARILQGKGRAFRASTSTSTTFTGSACACGHSTSACRSVREPHSKTLTLRH